MLFNIAKNKRFLSEIKGFIIKFNNLIFQISDKWTLYADTVTFKETVLAFLTHSSFLSKHMTCLFESLGARKNYLSLKRNILFISH